MHAAVLTDKCDGALQRFARPGRSRSDRQPERDFCDQALPFDAESQQLTPLTVCEDLDRASERRVSFSSLDSEGSFDITYFAISTAPS